MTSDDRPNLGEKVVGWVHLLSSVATIISNLAPTLGGVLVAAALAWAIQPGDAFQAIVSGLPSAILIGSLILGYAGINRERRISAEDLNRDWQIIRSDRRIIVYSPTQIHYEHVVEARARTSSADTLRWQTAWTGTGSYKVVPRGGGLQVHEDQLSNAFGERFRLILSTPVARGQVGKFAFRIETCGDMEQQKPFIAVSIRSNNGPKVGVLEILFDEAVGVERVWAEEYVGATLWPHSTTEVALANRSATYQYKRKLGRKHVLCWTYSGAQSV